MYILQLVRVLVLDDVLKKIKYVDDVDLLNAAVALQSTMFFNSISLARVLYLVLLLR